MPDAPRFRTDPVAALRAALRWVTNPVSIDGAASLPKISYAVGGPGLYKKVEEMRAHPDGSRVLADRPDLGAVLDDLDTLAAMPDGSLGRAYHAFMSQPEAVPGKFLAALMYRGPEWDDLDWTDEMRFVFERSSHTHDLQHCLSGYGTHLAAEAVNIGFIIGLEGAPPMAAGAFAIASNAVLWPTIGARSWNAHVMRAFRRGQAAHRIRPFHCTYLEELLPRPLDEVRAEWGIETLPAPLDTSDWLGNPLARRMANGYADAPADPSSKAGFIEVANGLVDAGVPLRVLVNLTEAEIGSVAEQFAAGATLEAIAASLLTVHASAA